MKNYNDMCKNCMKLNADCEGCTNEVYSGCVYKVECKNVQKPEEITDIDIKASERISEIVKRIVNISDTYEIWDSYETESDAVDEITDTVVNDPLTVIEELLSMIEEE